MSENKFKYFQVETVATVQANNQTDAIALARGRRGVSGKVLDTTVDINRVPATVAKAQTATA